MAGASDRIILSNISFLLLLVLILLKKCVGDEIIGCGGFVKSHTELDFSKIEIGLYTKDGSLKEKTECAPTNGYYFLPIYDRGDYVLKVHPPPGWSFEPSQYSITVDGTDLCSTGQDVNFSFNGFGITGSVVTAGLNEGPGGIVIQMVNEKGEKKETVTAVGGDFHFTPVVPGKYTLKAVHATWKLEPSQVTVIVKEGNTVIPKGALAVKGYEVRGSAQSHGSPIAGLHVLLYSKTDRQKYRVEGCKTALLQGVPDAPICYSVTDLNGEFSFGLVPAGEYKLVALPQPPGQSKVRYDVNPDSLTFIVQHDGQYIRNAFEVSGFTISGRVLSATNGEGVGGARVSAGEGAGGAAGTALTDRSGYYTLPRMEPGVTTITVQHEQFEFEPIKLSISPSGVVSSTTVVASKWRACGVVTAGPRRTLVITKGSHITRVVSDDEGNWCTFLPVGKYSVSVEVSDKEQQEGLQFYPLSQSMIISSASPPPVVFSRLKAEVEGRVRCGGGGGGGGGGCDVTVTLTHAHDTQTLAHVDSSYTFRNVLPGAVVVSVPGDRLCWRAASHTLTVGSAKVQVPDFEATGYVVRIHATHHIEVEYECENATGVFSVQPGAQNVCVPKAGKCRLRGRGCHTLQTDTADITVGGSTVEAVHFRAIAHEVGFSVTSPELIPDLLLAAGDEGGAAGPYIQKTDGDYVYRYTMQLAEGEVAMVSASSANFLISPSGVQQIVGANYCQKEALLFTAERGRVVAGKIDPPTEGVTVTLTSDSLTLSIVTGPDGEYRFGPLPEADYSVAAEKDGYILTEPDDDGVIKANKMAEIVVQIDAPIEGTLVSVSGGSYRRTLPVPESGTVRFPGLRPAQYYVRPHHSELKFDPPHWTTDLKGADTNVLKITGERVAWRCTGRVVSLGGAGVGAGLAAAPAPHHAPPPGLVCAPLDARADHHGYFKVRGLRPGCVYTLTLREAGGAALAHPPPLLQITEEKDVEDIRLIVIQPTQLTDANVLVYTPNIDHYKTLRLTLSPEDNPTNAIYNVKLDANGYTADVNPGLMYTLPRLPADNKSYVVHLESSLSKNTHVYKEEKFYFTSDGHFKSFDIEFLPKVKSSSQELGQTSFLIVPLLAVVGAAFLYRDLLMARFLAATNKIGQRAPPKPTKSRTEILDKARIDQILSNVNNTGKRAGSKKTPLI